MSTEHHHIDDLLKAKFLAFEVDVPASDWFAIEEKLNNKRRYGWIWWAALPLLIVSSLGLYVCMNTSSNKKTEFTKIKPIERLMEAKNVKPSIDINLTPAPTAKLKTYPNKSLLLPNKTAANELNTETENTHTTQLVFESILLNSKSFGYFWKQSSPTVDPLKESLPLLKKSKKTLKFGIEFGINLAPTMGLDAITKNNSNYLNREYLNHVGNSSSLGSGFNNGLHAQLNIGEKWFIRSGVYSSTYKVDHAYDFVVTEAPNVTIGQGITYYIPLNPSDYRHIKQEGGTSVTYISIPLCIGNRYGFAKNWGMESKIGFNLSNLRKSDGQIVNPTYLNLEDINGNNSIKKWAKGLTISSGVYYKTNNNLIFTVEPNYSTLLGSAQVKDYPVKTRFYNYGVNVNINYILGKK